MAVPTRNYTYANAATTWEGAERKSKQSKNNFLPFSSFPVSPQYLPLAQNPTRRQLTSEPGKCSLQASFHMPCSTKEVIGGQNKVASRQ